MIHIDNETIPNIDFPKYKSFETINQLKEELTDSYYTMQYE